MSPRRCSGRRTWGWRWHRGGGTKACRRIALAQAARGATLLELVVGLAILSVVLLIAGRLLLEAQQQIALSGRHEQGLQTAIALRQLRLDLQGASFVAGGLPLWSREALALVQPGGRRVRWQEVEGELRRAVDHDDGTPRPGRTMVRGVKTWRWRMLGGDLVEVDLVYAQDVPGTGRADLEPIWVTRPQLIKVRGGGGRTW